MRNALIVIHLIVSLLLMVAILVQNKSSGLSGAISGQGGAAMKSTKRGAEKVVYQATIILAILFVGLSLVFIFVP